MTRHSHALLLLMLAAFVVCPGCEPAYRDPATGVKATYEWETLKAEFDQEIDSIYPAARFGGRAGSQSPA